jgi:hypothetical protein
MHRVASRDHAYRGADQHGCKNIKKNLNKHSVPVSSS